MLDPPQVALIHSEPCDRPDRARRENESKPKARLASLELFARRVKRARPEQLSLASDGWQIWADSSIRPLIPRVKVFSVRELPAFQAGIYGHS